MAFVAPISDDARRGNEKRMEPLRKEHQTPIHSLPIGLKRTNSRDSGRSNKSDRSRRSSGSGGSGGMPVDVRKEILEGAAAAEAAASATSRRRSSRIRTVTNPRSLDILVAERDQRVQKVMNKQLKAMSNKKECNLRKVSEQVEMNEHPSEVELVFDDATHGFTTAEKVMEREEAVRHAEEVRRRRRFSFSAIRRWLRGHCPWGRHDTH